MKEYATKLALASLTYLTQLTGLFVLMMLFVLVDLISGIVASSRKKIPRSSRRLRKSLEKTLCYLGVVMLAYAAQKEFGVDWFIAHKAIAAFICVVEFISILENFAVITERPVFLKIITLIRGKASKADSLVGDILNEKNEPKTNINNGKSD